MTRWQRLVEWIGRLLCSLSWHKWGPRTTTVPYMMRGRLVRRTFVRCRREGCNRSKYVEEDA